MGTATGMYMAVAIVFNYFVLPRGCWFMSVADKSYTVSSSALLWASKVQPPQVPALDAYMQPGTLSGPSTGLSNQAQRGHTWMDISMPADSSGADDMAAVEGAPCDATTAAWGGRALNGSSSSHLHST